MQTPSRFFQARGSHARPVAALLGRLRRIAPLGLIAIGAGCLAMGEALPPPIDQLYFPTGLVVAPDLGALFVANSDFDLQYSNGTVMALDLTTLRSQAGRLLSGLSCVVATLQRPAGETTVPAVCATVGDAALTTVEQACALVVKSPAVNDDPILHPGPCAPLSLPLPAAAAGASPETTQGVKDKRVALIGAFASSAVLVQNTATPTAQGAPGPRLFVTVRGDPSLTFFDLAPEKRGGGNPALAIDCGQGADAHCVDANRVGRDPFENSRATAMPVEPVGVAASEDGIAILVAHQTQKAVSLSINRASTTGTFRGKPTLEFILAGLPDGPSEVATVPVPRVVNAVNDMAPGGTRPMSYNPGFLVTYRAAPEVDLLRFNPDRAGLPPRPFLTRASGTAITISGSGVDSRGIAVDASARRACEATCDASQGASKALGCLCRCASTPLRVFIANRAPSALLVGKLETTLSFNQGSPSGTPEALCASGVLPTGAADTVSMLDTIPLADGVSKVVLGNVIGRDGKDAMHVFVAAFDSRLVFAYDPEARRIDAVIRTGRGPHALAVDRFGEGASARSFLYVTHFTDSYLGVVDLDMRHADTFGAMFASVGTPVAPKESK
jgi:DNA-binding beta-propeller fold protein YncE